MIARAALAVLLLFPALPGTAQIILSEVDLANSRIELVNIDEVQTINVAAYWFCNRVSGSPNYLRIGTLGIVANESTATDYRMAPGQLLTIQSSTAFLPSNRGELGLYRTNTFGTRSAMVDYLNYGTSTGIRDFTAMQPPAIWVLDTAIDVSGTGVSDTIQLNFGAPGNEVAHYSVARGTPGFPQSLAIPVFGRIVLSELDLANSKIELANTGNGEVDLTGYMWCNEATGIPNYVQVSPAFIDPANSTVDSLQVPPGGVLTFTLSVGFLPPEGGELALYDRNNAFTSRDALVDYLAYGNTIGVRDTIATLAPAIWELDTAVDLTGANPGETIQLNPGEFGDEVAHYSVAPATLGHAQSIIVPTLRITAIGFVDADTCFLEFEYSGSGTVKVTEAADLITFADVAARTPVASPSPTRFEFDVAASQLFFRLEEE